MLGESILQLLLPCVHDTHCSRSLQCSGDKTIITTLMFHSQQTSSRNLSDDLSICLNVLEGVGVAGTGGYNRGNSGGGRLFPARSSYPQNLWLSPSYCEGCYMDEEIRERGRREREVTGEVRGVE